MSAHTDLQAHYRALYAQHGDSPQAVQWSSLDSQQRRFAVLTEVAQAPISAMGSVLDLGCGLGALRDYLRAGGHTAAYTGLDFVGEFIDRARVKYADDAAARFEQHDLSTDAPLPFRADWVLLSGVFNNPMADNAAFIRQTLLRMYEACERGIAFNAMSTYVDFRADNLYYADPTELFDWVKRHLSRRATLRHDYLVKEGSIPFEFTCYVYR